ncbi:caib/baif family protein [Anaeromyxobacter terrae]|uniref:caib/baif family protein n=1 Tax=Anaeromyxobacter terrae TaxID=2925406 RepID=UPI001F5686BF|nr:caib/baif family protein [Anaeromyxobacter sp. SG22]
MFIDTAAGTFQDLRPPAPPVMSRREFEAELQRLLREYAGDASNPGSIHCEGCQRCTSCMFCVDCVECYRCTHSRGCRSSSHLTHCVGCEGCHDCAYCVESENCTQSSYLVLSRACSECTYCFGCVGLAKKDFHILNVKYSRTEYFRIVKSLQEELGLAR